MHHLETLLERALDAVVGMDSDGKVIAWNQAAEAIFGWPREEAMDRPLGDLIVPEVHRAPHAAGLKRYIETGHGPVLEKRVKITALHRNGTEFPVELSIFPLVEDGLSDRFYAFIRSLAEQEASSRQQELRTREAEVLLKVAEKLIENSSLEDFTRFCLEQVCEVAGMRAAHLYYVRGPQQGQTLVPSGSWYIAEERFRPIIDVTTPMSFVKGEGLPGRAWQAGRLLVLDHIDKDPTFLRREVFGKVHLTRGIALPIQQGDKTYAVMEFFGPTESRIDLDILRMLQTIGTQIGVAIRRKEAAEYRETLRRELSHRVGNSLAVLASIYRHCAREAETIDDLTEAFLGRLTTMGQANLIAIKDARNPAMLEELAVQALAILPTRDHVTIDLPEVVMNSDWVMPISLTLHELATNFLKYGTPDAEAALRLSAEVTETPRELHLLWEETRLGDSIPCDAQSGSGFGTRLIQSMIEGRLNGRFERHHDADSFTFKAVIPLPPVEDVDVWDDLDAQ